MMKQKKRKHNTSADFDFRGIYPGLELQWITRTEEFGVVSGSNTVGDLSPAHDASEILPTNQMYGRNGKHPQLSIQI